MKLPPLQTCPFCTGSAAWLRLWTYRHQADTPNEHRVAQGRIVCTRCGARTDTGTIEVTTHAWNRRP